MVTSLSITDRFNGLVYSRSAAARVLRCSPWQIHRLEVWATVVFVVFQPGMGRRPRFVSKRSFTSDFARSRQERARSLTATPWASDSSKFTVSNDHSSSSKAKAGVSHYTVAVHPDRLVCECRD